MAKSVKFVPKSHKGKSKVKVEETVSTVGMEGLTMSNKAVSAEELAEIERYKQSRIPRVYSGRKIGRNEPCPCGSGKKFKKCHLPLEDRA